MVVDSSGNTAHAVARLAPAFGFQNVKVVLSADVPASKTGILAALSSVEIIQVGGGKSVSARAQEEGQRPGHVHLDQYRHLGNMRAHELYTGPEIARVLDGDVGIIAIAMGSTGTAAGVAQFFHEKYPATMILGVRPILGEQVPGARDKAKIAAEVTIPWETVVDEVVEVGRKEACAMTRFLGKEVEPQVGPTSGLACVGLYKYLNTLDAGDFEALSGKTAAFICPDSAMLYSDVMIAELDTGQGL
jgi:cysteine synthase